MYILFLFLSAAYETLKTKQKVKGTEIADPIFTYQLRKHYNVSHKNPEKMVQAKYINALA